MTNQLFTTPATTIRRQGLRVPGLMLAVALVSAALYAQQPATPPAVQPAQTPAAQQPADQSAGSQTDISAPTIKFGVNEVNLIFTVTDKHGRYNPNLRQSDFALLDDQKAPAKD